MQEEEKLTVTITDWRLIKLLKILCKNEPLEVIVKDAIKRYLTTPSVMHQMALELRHQGCNKEEVRAILSLFASPISVAKVVTQIFGSKTERGLNELLHMKLKGGEHSE